MTSKLWFPYAQHKTIPQPLEVVGAEGCRIKLKDGRELIDGISSWWTTCHGNKHPHIIKAIQAQAAELPHIMFAGLVHEPAIKLSEKLCKIAPTGLERVFFCDSGSVAVEVAMKMAVQYWHNLGRKRKQRFISFHNAYHGDTMGAMSLADPERGMHASFDGYMPRQASIPIPHDEYGFQEFEEMLAGLQKEMAGVIIEPLVQAAGGMKFHSADILAEIYRITKKFDLLFIADEIATGFGRTGYMFACQEAGITPDIMCSGKALTGGTVSLAAAMTTSEVFSAFLADETAKAFMHGPTYMANPMACAAAIASLELFDMEPRLKQVEEIEKLMLANLEPCRALPHVLDVRVKGALGVVQFDPRFYNLADLRAQAPKLGVWLRPFGDIIYLAPPFIMDKQDINSLATAIRRLLAEHALAQPDNKSADPTD